jgi:hypothetical protein
LARPLKHSRLVCPDLNYFENWLIGALAECRLKNATDGKNDNSSYGRFHISRFPVVSPPVLPHWLSPAVV